MSCVRVDLLQAKRRVEDTNTQRVPHFTFTGFLYSTFFFFLTTKGVILVSRGTRSQKYMDNAFTRNNICISI